MIHTRWGRSTLMAYYRATNRDSVTFDILAVTAESLAPIEPLRLAWTAPLQEV